MLLIKCSLPHKGQGERKLMSETILTIADLIPVGRENAISKERLMQLCITSSLIDDSTTDKNRLMRRLIAKDRVDFVILNLSDGNGYYRVSHDDLLDLQRYIKQEESRAKKVFKNITLARALYDDLLHERKAT